MKIETKRILIISVIVLVLVGFFVMEHEAIHKQIDDFYGVDSKLYFDWKSGGRIGYITSEASLNNLTEKDYEDWKILQLQTEQMGYTTYPFFILMLTWMALSLAWRSA